MSILLTILHVQLRQGRRSASTCGPAQKCQASVRSTPVPLARSVEKIFHYAF